MNDEHKAAYDELAEIMNRYGRLVYGTARAHLLGGAEADDVFQEVFLLYYTKELYFEDETARRSWLIRTAVNLCRAANRSPWNLHRDEDLVIDDAADEIQMSTAAKREVWSAVTELKEKYRVPVYLYYFENMPISEIARALGLKEGTVQMHLTRARKKLKERLEGEYFG